MSHRSTKLKLKKIKATALFEQGALNITKKIGSVESIIIHSLIFVLFAVLGFSGADWNTLLLILTTIVSLEAIYLAIFIQMTVNQNTQSLAEVEEDIDEIQKDIDDIQEDVDEIQEDVDDIVEDDKEAETHELQQIKTLEQIQVELQQLAKTIGSLRPTGKRSGFKTKN